MVLVEEDGAVAPVEPDASVDGVFEDPDDGGLEVAGVDVTALSRPVWAAVVLVSVLGCELGRGNAS